MQSKKDINEDHNIKKLNYAINFMNDILLDIDSIFDTAEGMDINKSEALYQIRTKADKFIKKTNGEIKLIHTRIKTIKTMEKNVKQEKYFSELLKLLNDKINITNEKIVSYSNLKKEFM